MKIIKKNGMKESYSFNKIIDAINKSAKRIGVILLPETIENIKNQIEPMLRGDEVSTQRIHEVVEMGLQKFSPDVGESYKSYRNWSKKANDLFADIENEFHKTSNNKDRSNSNANTILNSAKRTNVSKLLLKEMYKNTFLDEEQIDAINDGYIYIHDLDNRSIGSFNCCVVKMEDILNGGFNINGYYCKEPKDINNAVGVIGDIIVTCASAQYGGFSVAEIDTTLAKYCEKTNNALIDKYMNEYKIPMALAISMANEETKKDLENALQALEFQLNTRESSRGDYPFVTMSFGKDLSYWGRIVSQTILNVRMKGHGEGVKQKAIFPKLVYIVRDDGMNEDLFKKAIECSSKCLYPDYIPESKPTPMGKITVAQQY